MFSICSCFMSVVSFRAVNIFEIETCIYRVVVTNSILNGHTVKVEVQKRCIYDQ